MKEPDLLKFQSPKRQPKNGKLICTEEIVLFEFVMILLVILTLVISSAKNIISNRIILFDKIIFCPNNS